MKSTPYLQEGDAFKDKLESLVNRINSSEENKKVFQPFSGIVNFLCESKIVKSKSYPTEEYHIHHHEDNSCELHDSIEHDHDYSFTISIGGIKPEERDYLLRGKNHPKLLIRNHETGTWGKTGDRHSPLVGRIKPKASHELMAFHDWLQCLKIFYWHEMPKIDYLTPINDFIVKLDDQKKLLFNVSYRVTDPNDIDIQLIEKQYYPSSITNAIRLAVLIVKVMYYQQRFIYKTIPEDPHSKSRTQFEDWYPKQDWKPYPRLQEPIKKKTQASKGKKALQSFVEELNNNAYLRDVFKNIPMTIQFCIKNDPNFKGIPPEEFVYLILKPDGSYELHEGISPPYELPEGEYPTYDFFTNLHSDRIHSIFKNIHYHTHYESIGGLVRTLTNYLFYSSKLTRHGQRCVSRWASRIIVYQQIKYTETKYLGFAPSRNANFFKGRIPYHSRWSNCSNNSDGTVLGIFRKLGQELSCKEFNEKHGSQVVVSYRDWVKQYLHTRYFQYKNIFWFIREQYVHIFALPKDLFDLAVEHNVKSLPFMLSLRLRDFPMGTL